MPSPTLTELYVMKLLVKKPASYALQLVKHSDGKLKLGSVYVILGRIQTNGWVVKETIEDGQKKQSGHRKPRYTLTDLGHQMVKDWQKT